jgi:cytochrome c55X
MTLIRSFAALSFAATLIAGLPAMAQNTAAKADDRPDRAQVERGKQLYASHCSHCHGFNMMSAGNVTYDLREFPLDQQERFFESVTNGKNNRMPPWGDVLTQDEIGDIWSYVRTRGKS